ncbi:SDR family oxidoreductase [Thermoleptolyngbya sp. C42_A2020_037]|uniref:SDR family oxidoreductase n=1 Tax=Thermoleptolyngbya sp. C42_A2020_037 TaxID=2747799 RepID=UPI001A0EAA8B|nr:SDR family oxidoreductase [Thermoleptolyngbya sp. C42_A2020_037]MBF2083706.1 SDR family oxidoreductase [Thermoleptolyngbya sp. C42_A2020_037]
MASIQNQIVLITGASSGIGAACAHFFAEAGARLILVARRLERLEALAAALKTQFGTETLLLQLDVGDRPRVESTLSALPEDWAAVDILVNNAGLSRGLDKLHEGDFQDWEEMIDTNIKGLLYVTRAILPGMVQRDRGHVINIGSIAGHQPYPGGNVYCATKAAVKSLTECIKLDLLGTAVRITSVDPGMVETEFSEVRFYGDGDRARKVYQGLTPLTAEDIADVVLYCATRPPHVNINDVILMPVAQASTTMAHRRL